jgi:hypothetical protein
MSSSLSWKDKLYHDLWPYVPLPVSREIDARPRCHRQSRDAVHLLAIAEPPIILTP